MADMGPGDIVPALGTVASVAAAVGSCAAAYFAARSAEATRATVGEMQADRRNRAKPLFSLELKDGLFKWTWTLDKPSLVVEVLPSSAEGAKAGRYPSLEITNFGGAALDVSLEFALLDDAPITFPGSLRATRIKDGEAYLYVKDKWLSVSATNRASQLMPCHPTAKVTLPHCGAGQTRTVFFPEELISFAFVRALTDQRRNTGGSLSSDPVENMKNIRNTFAPTYVSKLAINIVAKSEFETVTQAFIKFIHAGPPQDTVREPFVRDESGRVLTQSWTAVGADSDGSRPGLPI